MPLALFLEECDMIRKYASSSLATYGGMKKGVELSFLEFAIGTMGIKLFSSAIKRKGHGIGLFSYA